MVPESKDAIAFAFQPCTARSIARALFRITMLATIQLNDQLLTKAGEVDDEGAARYLAPELVTFQLPVT